MHFETALHNKLLAVVSLKSSSKFLMKDTVKKFFFLLEKLEIVPIYYNVMRLFFPSEEVRNGEDDYLEKFVDHGREIG